MKERINKGIDLYIEHCSPNSGKPNKMGDRAFIGKMQGKPEEIDENCNVYHPSFTIQSDKDFVNLNWHINSRTELSINIGMILSQMSDKQLKFILFDIDSPSRDRIIGFMKKVMKEKIDKIGD